MKATITDISEWRQSKYSGHLYRMICFSTSKGSAITYIDPKMTNFTAWVKVIRAGTGSEIDGLTLKKEGLINADSKPIVTKGGEKT